MSNLHAPPDQLVVGADGLADPRAVAAVAKRAADGAGDVLVLAHGWNETPATAAHLYRALTGRLAERLAARPAAAREITAVGVVWPAVKWADADGAGGGASLGDDVLRLHETITEVADGVLAAQLRALATVLDTVAGRRRFVETLRRRLPDAAVVADDDPLPAALACGDTEELFAAVGEAADAAELGAVATVPGRDLHDLVEPAAGAALGWGFPDLSWLVLARRLIDVTSYYEMKARAGRVGAGSVAPLVAALQDRGVRVHLAGHSFGARVMACAASESAAPVQSLTLLQGAFSHVGFAPAAGGGESAGAFRRAVTDGVAGPTVVTHTHNDRAVTLAYAIASRLARRALGAPGDADDPYGGIGANGAVRTPETVAGRLGPVGETYAFAPRRVHNLRADRFVAGHADIRGPEVANALLQAVLPE